MFGNGRGPSSASRSPSDRARFATSTLPSARHDSRRCSSHWERVNCLVAIADEREATFQRASGVNDIDRHCRGTTSMARVKTHLAKISLIVGLFGLFDGVSERLCIVPNPNVPGHDDNQSRRLTKQFRCCQMHGVKRSNRFHRKQSADAGQDGVRYCNQEASPLESTQRPHCSSFLVSR
jgi:hypothetical protein